MLIFWFAILAALWTKSYPLNNGITITMNIFGIYLYTLLFKNFNFLYCTIFFSIIVLLYYAFYIKKVKVTKFIMISFFLTTIIYADYNYFAKDNISRLQENQIMSTLFEYNEKNGDPLIYYDSISDDSSWFYYNFRIYNPDIIYKRFRSPNE